MAEERKYIFTKNDSTIIKNTPTDRYNLGICWNHGVYGVKVEKDHLDCPFCDNPGMKLDKEKYSEEVRSIVYA